MKWEEQVNNLKWIGYISACICFAFMISCKEDYVPKPRGFQRIEFPQRAYKTFSSECGFSMEVPTYSEAIADNHPAAEKCWYNIEFPEMGATLHVSYKSFTNEDELFKLTEDARTLVYKHTIKADEIYETQISNNVLQGMLYELSGNTATQFQFYVTDGKRHYLRGSLYFNSRTNNDSIAPVLDFLKQDIIHGIEKLKWK